MNKSLRLLSLQSKSSSSSNSDSTRILEVSLCKSSKAAFFHKFICEHYNDKHRMKVNTN